jgi:hypothetical protein
MRLMLVINSMLLRMMMVGLRAIPMAMRVLVLSDSRALGRILIFVVPVTELVVKKLSCYPVLGGKSSEIPDILSLWILALDDMFYGIIF